MSSAEKSEREERLFLLRFHKVWEDSLEVRWERRFRDTRKVLKFHLIATSLHYSVERHFSFNEMSFRLHALEPGTELKVVLRVLVQAEGEEEMWILGDSRTMTTLQTPQCAVKKVFPTSLCARIEGNTPREDDPSVSYSKVDKYEVNVIEKDRVFASHACNMVVPGAAEEFMVPNMLVDTIFFVKIRAVSDSGMVGRWSEPTRFLTLQDVQVTVSEIGETYCLVRWARKGSDPAETSKFDDKSDAIEEFVFDVMLLPDQRLFELDPSSTAIKVMSKTFSSMFVKFRAADLLPGRDYVLRSRYRNSYGDYSEWVETSLATLPPISPPQVNIITHNYIQASWQRGAGEGEDAAKMSKNVALWEIQCTNMMQTKEMDTEAAKGQPSTTMQLKALNVESRLLGLTPGTEYMLRARAQDMAGSWGPWSEPTFTTTLHALKPRCEVAGETWLQIAWDRAEKRYNDNITRFHVQISCATNPYRASRYFPATQTSFNFDTLRPNTLYLLAIQACSEERWGPWSCPVEVRTSKPCEVSLIRRSEDLVQVKWDCEYYKRNQVEGLDHRYMVRIMNKSQLIVEEETTNNNYRRSGLTAGMRLSVFVRAYDYQLQNWGLWSNEFDISTLGSVITATAVGETFIQVSWNRRPKLLSCLTDQELAKGIEDALSAAKPEKYVLRVCSLTKGGLETELSKFHLSADHPTFYTIADLEPDHAYSVQICVLDSKGTWSPYSSPNTMRTIPSLEINVADVGEHYVSLGWTRPSSPAVHNKELLEMESKLVCKNLDDDTIPAAHFHCIGEFKTVLRDLVPNMTYEIHVCAKPVSIDAWGSWSKPVYIRTSSPFIMELESVGESYAHLLWRREAVVVSSFRAAQTVMAGVRGPSSAEPAPHDTQGCLLYIGDATPTEYHVKIFKRELSEMDAIASATEGKTLALDIYLAATQNSVRIPALLPNTQYEAVVCGCTRMLEWGQWSNTFAFATSSPTELHVQSITQDSIRCHWGQIAKEKVSEQEDSVSHYQLQLSGMDDDFNQEVILPPSQRHYDINGLSINSCYAVSVRSFMSADNDWGPYCNRAFICVRAIQVELREVREDWIAVQWENRHVADNRMKILLMTLVGERASTTITLDNPNATSHTFKGLDPNSCYTVHLLCIEQSPCYLKNGGFVALKNRRKIEVEAKDMHRQTISMPIIATDYRNVFTDGLTVLTERMLLLRATRVGENFASLEWGKGDNMGARILPDSVKASDKFCLDVITIDGRALSPELEEFKKKVFEGNTLLVQPLVSCTRYRFSIRCLSHTTDNPTMWSAPCTLTTLRTVTPVLGGIEISATDEHIQGTGEDYITFNWAESMHEIAGDAQSTSLLFQPRIVNAFTGEERTAEISDCVHTFTGLNTDTTYHLSVRTIITYAGSTDTEPKEVKVLGEWSQVLVSTTLGPMVVRVINAAETFATVQWRRKEGTKSWEDPFVASDVLHSISSFHIRLQEAPSESPGHSFRQRIISEHHYLEGDEQYNELSAMLSSLQPGTRYTVHVRASTMNQWGSWSEGVTFTTLLPAALKIALINEDCAYLTWVRESAESSILVRNWELQVSTVGSEFVGAVPFCIAPDRSLFKLSGLTSNTSYDVAIRAVYPGKLHGPWSARVQLTTLGGMKVEVGRIGETFVYVTWSRVEQNFITSKLRQKFLLISESQRRAGGGSEAPTPTIIGDQPVSIAEMMDEVSEEVRRTSIPQVLTKLQEMQIAEMEKKCVYPDGEDMKYEVVVTLATPETVAGLEADGASQDSCVKLAATEAKHKPFRRRIGKGEYSCRLEGLDPQSQYSVVIRAVFSNGLDVTPFEDPTKAEGSAEDLGWGQWSPKVIFTTLKPICLILRGVCSESIVVEWDTGSQSQNTGGVVTAISKYQLVVTERQPKGAEKKPNPFKFDVMIEDAEIKMYTVTDLSAWSTYVAKIRVCYEEDKWGIWSNLLDVLTLPRLCAQVQSISENKIEFLAWREEQVSEDPAFVPWTYAASRHQLRINMKQTPQPFLLELNTSTLLTLDTLMTDTRYEISVREEDVNGQWQPWLPLLASVDTRPYAPQKPYLTERRGNVIAIQWDHQKNPSITQRYVYQVEMAELTVYQKKTKTQKAIREYGDFRLVGYTVETTFRLQIERPVNECFFRVRVCKEGHSVEDREFNPLEPNAEGHVVIANENLLLWSKWSPTANFRTPSIPDHPSELHITHLTHSSATLRWRVPDNYVEHEGLFYKVYLTNNYGDPFTFLGTTTENKYALVGLVPNCHYRVLVTAESRMGNSKNNKTLHFSTRVMKDIEPPYHPLWQRAATTLPTATSPMLRQRIPSFSNPTMTTLPPRAGIRVRSFLLQPRAKTVQDQLEKVETHHSQERQRLLSARIMERSQPRGNRIAPLVASSPVPVMGDLGLHDSTLTAMTVDGLLAEPQEQQM